MRGRYLLWLCVVGLLAASVAPGMAAPAFPGFTGLLLIPTADVLTQGDWNAAIFAINLEEGADANNYCANLGVASTLEVGFVRVKPEDDSGDTLLSAKYQFLAETAASPAVAVGIYDLTDEVDATVYVVASKAFGQCYQTHFGEITSPRFHVGVGGGQLSSFFGGASAALGDRLLLMVEYDSDDINAGARFALNDEWRAHFGFLNGFDDVGLGVSYNKGF